MNTFVDFEKTDISNVVLNPDYFRSFEENEDHLLLDMDSYVQRKDDDLLVNNRVCDVSEKKCPLGEDAEDMDGSGWSSKPIIHWSQDETITWLMTAASCLGQPYCAIQQSLALPGKELAALTRQDFLARDPVYGERLYQLLHTQVLAGCKASGTDYQQQPRRDEPDGFPTVLRGENSAETFQNLYLEDEHQNVGSNNNSDAESDNSVEISTKRPPGRPRLLKTKKNHITTKEKFFCPSSAAGWYISSGPTRPAGRPTIRTFDFEPIQA